MDRLLSGVGDGCDSCLAPRSMWTDEETIDQGFPKNRTIENIRETWENLVRDKSGDIVKEDRGLPGQTGGLQRASHSKRNSELHSDPQGK